MAKAKKREVETMYTITAYDGLGGKVEVELGERELAKMIAEAAVLGARASMKMEDEGVPDNAPWKARVPRKMLTTP